MEIEEFRGRLDRFEEELNRALHRFLSGQSQRPETGGIFDDFSDLCRAETILELEQRLTACPAHQSSLRRSLSRCRAYVVERHLDRAVQPLLSEILAEEAGVTVPYRGLSVPLLQMRSMIAAEPGVPQRRRMSELCAHASAGTAGRRRQAFDVIRERSRQLGFADYRKVLEETKGIDYAALMRSLAEQLRSSESVYSDALSRSVQGTTGLPLGRFAECDVGIWLRGNRPPKGFAAEKQTVAAGELVRELAIEPEPDRSVTVDSPDLPAWRVQPRCIPVRVPHEIRVLVARAGGPDGYGSLLHESGHAHQLAWASPSLPAEFRRTGDRGLAETFGFLFESLLCEPAWLTQSAGVGRPEEFIRFISLVRSYRIRLHAARLTFDLEYHGDGIPEPEARWVEIVRGLSGVEADPGSWVDEAGSGFEAADYLRAWIFEAQLREFLRMRFGRAWYREKTAGRFLKEIWETGFIYSADELCTEIGLGDLDAQPLFDELRGGLRQ